MNFINRGYHSLSGPDTIELSDIQPNLPKQPTIQQTTGETEQYYTAPTTQMLAVAGLVASWVLGIVCVIVGSGAVTKPTTSEATKAYNNGTADHGPYHDWPEVGVSAAAAEILPLLASFIITAQMEGTGLIHETTCDGPSKIDSSSTPTFVSSHQSTKSSASASSLTLYMQYLSFWHTPPHRSCSLYRHLNVSANISLPLVVESTPGVENLWD
jgi:hypothetical protein